jgi:hypothetical protein
MASILEKNKALVKVLVVLLSFAPGCVGDLIGQPIATHSNIFVASDSVDAFPSLT